MTLFSYTTVYPYVSTYDRRNSSDVAFGVWASFVLIGLAFLSVALGVASLVDPAIFPTQ
jgi:hypothetical protein